MSVVTSVAANTPAATKLKVGVLFGGKSSENEVSLATGRYVLNLLDARRFTGVPIYMDLKGRLWRLSPKLVIMNTVQDVESNLESDATRIPYEALGELVQFVFNALLGKYGEDGRVQGLLELLKIPYTGSGILASAMAMNKRAHKDLLIANGFKVADDLRFSKAQYAETELSSLVSSIESTLGFPIIVKPVAEGSSVGVAYVETAESLVAAIEEAFRWDEQILIETFIKGQEFMCVVFGNENPHAMEPSEVEFPGDIFTYENKYMPGQAIYHTPIRTSAESVAKIQEIAVAVYRLLGIKGYGRVDGFLTEAGEVVINEPHTGSVMVPSSYVFQQASIYEIPNKAVGKSKAGGRFNPRSFITQIIELGQSAHEQKKGVL